MNSARFSLPTNRPKNRNTSMPRSRTRHDSLVTFSRKASSRRYARTVSIPFSPLISACARSAWAARCFR